MSNKSKKEYEIPAFALKMCEFKDRDFKILFWFVPLLTIHVLIMLISLPVTLIVWVILLPFGELPPPEYSSQIDKVILFVSMPLGFLAQYKLWKESKTKIENYKNNKRAV